MKNNNYEVPEHIAIIMDGNGRWAKKKLLPKSLGHKAGADTLQKIIDECYNIGVKYLTAYAFSTENWNRGEKEVSELMNLLRQYIDKYIKDVNNSNRKISTIGNLNALDIDLQQKIKELTNLTKNKEGIHVIIAINYGGRDEITRAIGEITKDIMIGKLQTTSITESCVSKYLDTKNIPDPDLVIRTSGELRISNFLLWQIAYSELYFSDKLWPDFNKEDLNKAIEFYKQRDRRFGATK